MRLYGISSTNHADETVYGIRYTNHVYGTAYELETVEFYKSWGLNRWCTLIRPTVHGAWPGDVIRQAHK